MIRISQAILIAAIAASITAMVAFLGGWKMATQFVQTTNSGIVAIQPAPGDGVGTIPAGQSHNTPSDASAQQHDDAASFAIYWDVWKLVHDEFYHTTPLNSQQMVYGSIRGMLTSLDDAYTSFEEPRVAERTRESMRGSFEGIGALLGMHDGEMVIVRPLRKSPAIKAGLQSNDVIMTVDGEDVATIIAGLPEEEQLNALVDRIRGEQGSEVTLTVRRPPTNDILEFTIVRDHVPLISVNSQMIDDIAHIQITEFRDTTPGELDEELRAVLPQQPRGIVLDIRQNPGGVLDSSLEVLGRFYDGVAMIEENSQGEERVLETRDAPEDVRLFDVPMVVLIDGRSASAAEIVAGALGERRPDTTLLGEKSFGKGSVQNLHKLRDNSSVRITIAHWFTPNKNEIHEVGITPEHIVSFSHDATYAMPCIGDMVPFEGDEACNDSQLSWAVRLLRDGDTPPVPTPTPESTE